MSTDATTCNTINAILQQKRQNALWNVPPNRANLTSPYPAFTKMQLDMRRKVEILKYTGQSSQVNNTTKSKNWTNIVSGKSARRNISQYSINNPTQNTDRNSACPADALIPTLTSSCDVPGPPMYLTYDPTVPLYNYINPADTRAYSQLVNNDTSQWKLYTKNEIDYLQSNTTTIINDYLQLTQEYLGVITITNYISSLQTSYSITTPIGIWCRGIYVDTDSDPYNETVRPTVPILTIAITGITLNVYYNNVLVPGGSISIPNSSYTLSNLVIDPNKTAQQMFYAVQYVGMLTAPSFTINTQPGYIYDVQLLFNYSYDTTNAAKLTAFEAGVFCNLSKDNLNVFANPTVTGTPNNVVTSSPSTMTYSTGSFTQYSTLITSQV